MRYDIGDMIFNIEHKKEHKKRSACRLLPKGRKNLPFCALFMTKILTLALLLLAGGNTAWGETPKVPDGIYYIRNNGTNKGYLWPSLTTNATTGYRYLTTSLSTSVSAVNNNNGVSYPAHDKSYCHWVVKNVTGGYIQLINPRLNQYVVIRAFPKANNTKENQYGDRDVWLTDDPATENLDYTYFVLNNDNSPYKISPKPGLNSVSSTTGYTFNSASGNDREWLTWSKSDNKPQNGEGREGLIQLFNGDPLWSFTPDSLDAPTINYDEDDHSFTISYDKIATGFDILYTTNGNDPTIGGTGVTSYLGGKVYASEDCTVKAVVARYGVVLTAVASQAVVAVGTPPAPVITVTDECSNTITITPAGPTIYYTTNGTPPSNTNGMLYSGPFQQNTNVTIKAVSYFGTNRSDGVTTFEHIAKTVTPTISVVGNIVTITGSGSVYYTTNGADPTTDGTPYSAPITLSDGSGSITIKAVAKDGSLGFSCVAEATARLALFINSVDKLNSLTANTDCVITADFDASSYTGSIEDYSGTFDGDFHTITGLTRPLFNSVNGGTVKNIMLGGVSISKSGNVGAIAGVASGYTRIYNCGILPNDATNSSPSTVASTDGYCGGLVGWLKDDSRVINCFSYANITNGTDVAGIVGYNQIASTTAVTEDKYANLRTAVVNCMFYGNITGGTRRYPVYGGAKMLNNTATGINNYDFYRANASVGTLADYNCSWPAKEEYLTHFEFYRNLLNSNRELCGWWVGSETAPSTLTTVQVQAVPKDASLMAKWVLDTNVAPYPILKKFGKYSSPVNIDANASWRILANEWEGKKLGTVKVTVNPGNHAASGVSGTSPTDYIITDMDTLHADYCYRKIQLPYYNTVFGNPNGSTWAAKYGGNYGEYVVTGWEITAITNADDFTGTRNGFTANWETGYDFADRNCTAKDIYNASTNKRIFAQGGYFYVPDNVKSIVITAHWANAKYIDNTDHSYDRVYMSGSNAGTHFAPAGYRTAPGSLTVQNGTIASQIPSGGSVFDNALVLVGNHQYRTGKNDVKGSSDTDGMTIMSADLDFDDEPDYCLEWQLGQGTDRQSICPIRFDFLPVAELGLAMKEDGSKQYYSLGCYRPLGHFEVTETSLIHFGQFEFSNVRTVDSPIILNGGLFDQYTKGTAGSDVGSKDKITYIILGGHVRMPSFTPGAHVNKSQNKSTRHCAVNVLGGNIDYLYLTGNYNEKVSPYNDNPHCYIDGGRLKQVAAAGKEGINGNVYFKINHSKIWEFYGGSTMDLATGDNYKIVKGNINVTIDNSMVDKYCGGPKFGDMDYNNNKTVTTNATNTTFGVYYGGGNGGTSYVQYRESIDGEQTVPYSWDLSAYTPETYVDKSNGYHADYNMEIVNTSAGTNSNKAVYRVYFFSAQFSATNTGTITNHLTNCKVLTNFYGGGNLGGVVGDVTSTLDGTTRVYGSAFGAGFSATIPDVTIYNKDKTPPTIDVNTGIITPESGGTSTTYTWTHESSLGGQTLSTTNRTVEVDGIKYFYTEKSLSNLGAVSGAATLKIKGNAIVEGKVFNEDGTVDSSKKGGVYGGGDASAVSGNTTVILAENAEIQGDVFGGGNNGEVGGTATVNIQQNVE